MCVSMGVFTYRSMHPTIDAVTSRETDRLDGGDVVRLHTPTPLGRLVGNLGALVEALETAASYAAVVHEEVLATPIRGDEAVAFIVVEPLYRSLGHIPEPTFLCWGSTAIRKPLLSHRGRRFSLTIKPTSIYCILTIPRARSESRKGPRPGLRSLRSRSRSNTTTIITVRTIPHLLPRTGSPEAS